MNPQRTQLFSRSLFSRKQELFLIGLFALCVVGAVTELAFVKKADTFTVNTLDFISKMIFLNHIHVFLTPLMLWATSTGRDWVAEQQTKNHLLNKSVVFITVSLLVTFFIYSKTDGFAVLILNTFVLSWGTFHIMRQSWGLSRLYRKKSGELEQDNQHIDFRVFNSIILLQLVISCIPKYKPLAEVYRYLVPLSYILVFVYIALPALRSKHLLTEARLYDFRILAYPFALGTTSGRFAMLSIHGLEYFFLTSKFLKREQTKSRVYFDTLVISVFLILVLSSFNLLRMDLTSGFVSDWFAQLGPIGHGIVAFLKGASITFTLYHFWVDGLMYRHSTTSGIFV